MSDLAPPPGLDEFLASNNAPMPQAVAAGATPPPPGLDDFIGDELNQAKYGTTGQQILTGVEGLAKGALGPIATAGERALHEAGFPGLSPEEQKGRQEQNPWIHGGAEALGLAAPAIATLGGSAAVRAGLAAPEAAMSAANLAGKFTQSGVLGAIGEGAAKLLPEASGAVAKIGSSAVKEAAELAAFGVSDELSKMINGEPMPSAGAFISHVGLNAVLGGALGAGGTGAKMLWQKEAAPKLQSFLDTIAKKVGGIEGVETPMDAIASKAGAEISPEVKALISGDPELATIANHLNQSDTTKAGRAFQQTVKEDHKKLANSLVESLGKRADQIPDAFDHFEHGKNIGQTLSKEYGALIEPIAKAYEDIADRHAGLDLNPSITAKKEMSKDLLKQAETRVSDAEKNLVKAKTKQAFEPGLYPQAQAELQAAQEALQAAKSGLSAPGSTDKIADEIMGLATREKWTAVTDGDIMKKVNSVLKDLPGLKTLDDLSKYIKGENFDYIPMQGSLNRAKEMMKSILRNEEGEIIASRIGSEEGPEALAKYRETQARFKEVAKLKDVIDERLNIKGSVTGYGKAIKEMAQSDAEGIFNRLSGSKDAAFLDFVGKQFPETAEAIRQAHLDQILTKAVKGGELNPNQVIASLNKLSPQLRGFVVPGESVGKIDAISEILQKFKDLPHNYSNTGRTVDTLLQHVPGSALGLAAMVAGHNPLWIPAMMYMQKLLGKELPDEARLAFLKWMGSGKRIDAPAFKAMVDYFNGVAKGEAALNKNISEMFKVGSFVSAAGLSAAITSPKKNDQLDERVEEFRKTPMRIESIAQNVGYYSPEHAMAVSGATTRALSYLSSIKPGETKNAPLDPVIKPNEAQVMRYRRALAIANNPISVLNLARAGQVTEQDVMDLKSMYPEFYGRISQKLTQALVDHSTKGKPIPYQTRMGLSVLLQQPMDSSLKSQNIYANQSIYMQAQAQKAQQDRAAKSSAKGIGTAKFSNRYALTRSDED